MISDLLSSLSRDRTSVGIELSRAAIRVAQVRRGRSGYVLERLLEEGLPEGLVDDNGVKDAAGVASFCGEFLREKKIAVQEVVLGVPERAVVIRMAALPSDLRDSELKKGLSYTFKRELPVDPSELYINYRVTEEQLDEGKSRQLVVAALGKQVGQELKDAFKVRGLRVCAIEFPSLALSRLTSFFSPDPDRLRVILNLGTSLTDLTLVDRGISCYATNFNVGAGDFAQMLSGAGSAAGSGGEDEFLMGIEPILNRVNIEIYRAIKYLQTVRKKTKEVDILLAGGWPQLPNFEMLLKGLRKKLNVPIFLPNLGDMRLIKGSDLEDVDFPTFSPIMAAAAGLALRPFDSRGIAMDLSVNSGGGRMALPVPLKPALAGALVFFLLLGGVGFAGSKVFHKKKVVAEVPAPLITSVPTPAVPPTQASSSTQSSKGFKEPHSAISEILDDLSRISKERLVFDEITMDNTGEVKLAGSALRQTHVFMLMNKMNNSRYFEFAALDQVNMGEDDRYHFTIKSGLKGYPQAFPAGISTLTVTPREEGLIVGLLGDILSGTNNRVLSMKKPDAPVSGGLQSPAVAPAPPPMPAATSAGLHYAVEVLGDYGSLYRLLTAVGGFPNRMIVDRVILKPPDEKVLPKGAKSDALSALVLISIDPGILRDSWERTLGREPAVSIAFRPVVVKNNEAPVSQGKKPVVTANNTSSAPPLPPPPDTLDTASKGTSETGPQKPASPSAGDWRLKGVIGEKGKDQVALIEHGGQGYYLKVGDVQNGARVIQILPDAVILLIGGSEIELTLPK